MVGLCPVYPRKLTKDVQTLPPDRMKADTATVHGFRSSFRDWAGNETSYPRDLIETALAHVIGDKAEQAYRRSDALEKRRILSFNSDTRGRAGFGEAV